MDADKGYSDGWDTDEAYSRGWDAFNERLDINDNPYEPLGADWNDWQRGYLDAEEQAGY